MKIGQYAIERFDPLNLVVTKTVTDVAKRNIIKKDGTVVHEKGDTYEHERFYGYYPRLSDALKAVFTLDSEADVSDATLILDKMEKSLQAIEKAVETQTTNI